MDWVPGDTFAARLILLRRELGLTTDELADLCGIKRATWSTWERGAAPRKMGAVVAQIALATGVSRDWLMWGGPLADPNGPSRLLRHPLVSDNATELMQYRYSSPLAGKPRRSRVKVAA